MKLRLNHWCHMDYFYDVPAAFLGLECGRSITVYRRVRKLTKFLQKYLNLCSEDEGGLTGLERHESE